METIEYILLGWAAFGAFIFRPSTAPKWLRKKLDEDSVPAQILFILIGGPLFWVIGGLIFGYYGSILCALYISEKIKGTEQR